MHILTITVVCSLLASIDTRATLADYDLYRNAILEEERSQYIGGQLALSPEEQQANDILMRWKHKELDEGFHGPRFNMSGHYFQYREHIRSSKVYQILRKMPKGAALHVHSTFMLDADSLIALTYEDHAYACYHDGLKLHFSGVAPTLDCPVEWTLLSDLRARADNATEFDHELKKHFTLITDDDSALRGSVNDIWLKFEALHGVIKSLISYRPVREKYFRTALEKFYEDNVMYIEIRTGLSSLYELDGRMHDKMYMARLYKDITDDFKREHPDFMGVKLILSTSRRRDEDQVREQIELAKKFKKELPELFAGFDLVGQEDLGRPLRDFVPLLRNARDHMNFYFHAGETCWFGTESDENLIDAVLLEPKRIGHAFALLKHPRVLKAVVKNDIAVEVNVISNVVLSLLRDVRNHPLASFLASGVPVVLSSDDPGAWDAKPLTDDYYVAFVAVASRHHDLALLKQLAHNSITYSALDLNGREQLKKIFYSQWEDFITYIRSVEETGATRHGAADVGGDMRKKPFG